MCLLIKNVHFIHNLSVYKVYVYCRKGNSIMVCQYDVLGLANSNSTSLNKKNQKAREKNERKVLHRFANVLCR